MNSLSSIMSIKNPSLVTVQGTAFTGYQFNVADVSSNPAYVYNFATQKWDGNFQNSSISTTIVKYGTGSIVFNNTQGYGNPGASYLKIPPILQSNVSNGMSITLWAYASSSNQTPYLFDFAINATSNSNNMICHYSTNNSLIFFPNITLSGTFIQVSNVIVYNQWQFITITINTSSLITIYIDTVSKYSQTFAINPLASSSYPKNNCIVGTTFYGNVGLVGNIDNLYIYNKVLTQSEINNIYNGNV